MSFISVLNAIENIYVTGNRINNVIAIVLMCLVVHRIVFFIIGMFTTRKFKPSKKQHKYGILIAARNEEKVIGNLLDSINNQDYPKDLLRVFVVADNSTDKTYDVAEEKGAIVYNRKDTEHQTKGYALEFLVDKISKDFGIEEFDGYFVFDADNLLESNYINKMNDAFDEGCKIITSYRNSKNFDENWISASYGLHWIRSARVNHRARSVLHLATNIQGTGFLIANEVIKDGWHYTSLTEDRALTADAVLQGYEITYQDEAIFYDEQPTNLNIALRQRLRWSRGHLEAFAEMGFFLFLNIFFGKLITRKKWNKENKKHNSFKDRIVEGIRHRFAAFDTLVQLLPLAFINLVRWIIFSLIIFSIYSKVYGISGANLVNSSLIQIFINPVTIDVSPGLFALLMSLVLSVWWKLVSRLLSYLGNMFMAIYVFIIEKRRIKKISILKKIWFIITWPMFDLIGIYTTYVAIFKKVSWKPIPHNSNITINDLKSSK